jgi:hypothetical protein
MRQDQSFAASRLPRPNKVLPNIGIATTFIAGRNHSPKPSTLHAARLAAVEAAHGKPLLESPSRALRSLKSLVLNSPPMRRFSASMPASPHGSRSFAGSGISRLRSCGSRADSSQLPSPFRLARVKASQRAKSARQGFSQTTPPAAVPEQGEEPEGEGQEGEERQQMSETAPPPMPAKRPPMPPPLMPPPPPMPPAPMAVDPAASRQPPPRVLEPTAPRQRPQRDTALPAPPRRPRSRELEPLQGRGAQVLGMGVEALGRGAEVAPRPDTWRVRSNGDLPRPPPRPPTETRRACSADGARVACPRTGTVRAAKTGSAAASAPSATAGAASAAAAAPSAAAARERRRSNPSVVAAKQPPAPPDPLDPFSELRSSGQSVLELLRVEAAPSEWVDTSEAEIAAGLALLGEVRAAADGLGCAQGTLWQALLYEQPRGGGGGGSGPVVQRTPLKRAGRSLSLDGTELLGFVGLEPLGAQRRHALGAGAARLRGLLRLSLMDDNDLQLAQRALREAAAFFEALRAAAAHSGRTPHALWESLQQPANARG